MFTFFVLDVFCLFRVMRLGIGNPGCAQNKCKLCSNADILVKQALQCSKSYPLTSGTDVLQTAKTTLQKVMLI